MGKYSLSQPGYSCVFFLIVMAFAALITLPQDTQAQLQMDREQIDQVSMAIVQVQTPVSAGSGSLVEGTNLIYTNRHVAEGYYEFEIHALTDLTETARPVFRAELVGYSDEYDFAVLRITGDMSGNPVSNPHSYLDAISEKGLFPQLRTAPLSQVSGRGDQMAVFGYPGIGDNELVITTGIISSVQYDEVYGERMPVWLRTNAEMSPGNSGGVATNMRGEMIGIPTYVRTESVTGGRLGSLLSMQVVNKILEENALLERWTDSATGRMAGMPGGEQLDFRLDSTFGSANLNAGFTPDPFSVSVISGGEINASYLQGDDCRGFASASPDYRLQWSGSSPALRLYFEADTPGDDTVLLINRPDGSWICNDDADNDFNTVNPLVEIQNPAEGQYDIWIASYDEGEYYDGTLFISELSSMGPGSGTAGIASNSSSAGLSLDFTEPPTYGRIELGSGFLPDPHTVEIVSGGSVDVSSLNLGSGCTGYAAIAPDLSLVWDGDTSDLRIFYEASDSSDDTVLIINTPSGQWICNDDAYAGTLNPMLPLSAYGSGRFDIWVASYSEGDFISGELKITELDSIQPR